jgi:hypothetical protein
MPGADTTKHENIQPVEAFSYKPIPTPSLPFKRRKNFRKLILRLVAASL